MRCLVLSLALSLVFLYSPAQIVIRNVTVLDVESKKLVTGQDVLIRQDRIAGLGKKLKVPQGTRELDGSGKFLVPGFVDAHVHFFQSGGIYTRPDALDLRQYKPFAEEIRWTHGHMASFLQRYLAAGITSVIDVGSTVNFLKQRDSFRAKSWAPSVYMTGPLLTTWEPQVFKGLKDDEPFFEMKSVEDARRYVRKQLPYKPDFIKIWYIVMGRNKDSAARAHLPMVRAVIDEAHKNNLRVAVHATERITAQLAVEAGADLLVHGIEDEPVDAAFVRLLKERGTVLTPTLVVAGNYRKVFGQEYTFTKEDFQWAHPTPLRSVTDLKGLPDTFLTRQLRNYVDRSRVAAKAESDLLRANTKKLLEGGVILATGTDAGNVGTQHVSSYFDELKAMKETGLDPWQLLQASTINGAKAMGMEAEFGSVKNGKRADLLLLNRNPLDDLANWQSIDLVINKGVVQEPLRVVASTAEELAEKQLAAYNAHNLEAFLEPYAEDVEIFTFPDKLMLKGKEAMRKRYEFLNHTPKLYCHLLNRIVQGNKVIDHEEVYGFGPKPVYAVAIYEIEGGKIRRVWFTQ